MPENIVFVVSSESKALMHSWYHTKAPNLGLAAENGQFWRWTSKNANAEAWNTLIDVQN